MNKLILIIFTVIIMLSVNMVMSAYSDVKPSENQKTSVSNSEETSKALKYVSAAVAIAAATISSGIAIAKIGSAAMGAVSERPEAGGTALILAALAEGVSLWGFLIAFFILQS